MTLLSIDRSIPFDPVAFIGEGWSIMEEDEHSLLLTEIDPTKVGLEMMLKDGEEMVVGEEKLKRLIASGNIRLDAKVLQTLWENKYLIPENWKQSTTSSTLKELFFGVIVVTVAFCTCSGTMASGVGASVGSLVSGILITCLLFLMS
jgi:hypothetical protein